MEAKQMVEETLRELEEEIGRAMEGLTSEELAWRPSEQANSIGFIFWHTWRAEDVWVSDFALNQPSVFQRDGWAEKWELPPKDTGYGYTPERLAAFNIPPTDELWEYHGAVRKQSLDHLNSLSPSDFDHKPTTSNLRRQGYTIGRMYGHLICEIGQHVGHIWYLRGLQRGIDK